MRDVTMNVRRVVWFGVWALAIASWFASASTSGVRPPIAPLPPPKPAAIDWSVAALQSEVSRLHDRIGPTASPAGSRDLFRFSARTPRRPLGAVPNRAPMAEADVAPPVAPRPSLKLIGIAEDASADGIVRTAIVSGPGDVYLVKAGDTVAGQYRVEQVSTDAVQLTNIATAASTTLALR
jgi:hypothetical protein